MKKQNKIREGESQMKKVIKLEDYREKKKEEELSQIDENGFREIPEEEYEEMLEYEIDLDFDNFTVYNDEFIEQNAEHIAHHTLPFCTVCSSPLREGDKVDTMWPLEYGFNVCQQCEDKMSKKIKGRKIINLDKLELILVEEDFKKIKDHLDKKDIHNINGNHIIAEELYQRIKYEILNGEGDDFFKLP
jgi:hypothetical protein